MDALIASTVLSRFRAALTEIYGDRLERAVLFGSRARGDGRAESDYDVAVFLRDYSSLWGEMGPLAKLTTDILVDTGAEISAKPFRAGEWREDRPLMHEIVRDGVDFVTGPQHIEKARRALASGRLSLSGTFNEDAGRSAYLAGFSCRSRLHRFDD